MEREAQEHFIAGRLSEAADAFRALGRRHPERMDIQARIGYLALLDNDPDRAIAHLATAINQGLRTRDNLGRLAEAYYRKGDLGSAAYCFQRIGREGLAGTLAVLAEHDPCRLTEAAEPVEIPWLTVDPLPTIEARVNGRVLNLVLDTGAGVTVIDTQIAVDAAVPLGGQEQLAFAGGNIATVTYGQAEELFLGGVSIHNVPVQMMDIRASFETWFPTLSIHGILGINVLSRFIATLDYLAACLRLAPAGPWEAGAAERFSSLPIWLAENNLLLTTGDLPGLDHCILFVDSAMTGGALAVPAKRCEQLGLAVDEKDALLGTGGGGLVQGKWARADWFRLDGIHRTNLDCVVLEDFPIEQRCGFPVHGLVGHEMLRGCTLTLDFSAMHLSLSPIPVNEFTV